MVCQLLFQAAINGLGFLLRRAMCLLVKKKASAQNYYQERYLQKINTQKIVYSGSGAGSASRCNNENCAHFSS